MCVIVVCLLYLLVLIDCRTISKSINNEYKANDGYEVITDLYSSTGNHKWKHHRNLHKHRRAEKSGIFAKSPVEMKAYDNITKEHRQDFRIDPLLAAVKKIENTTENARFLSTKRKTYVGGFWSRFKNKHFDKKHKKSESNKKDIKEKMELESTIKDQVTGNLTQKKCKHQILSKKQKRESSAKLNADSRDKTKKTTNIIKTLKTHLPAAKYLSTKRVNDNLSAELAKMTTEIVRLKELYSVDQYSIPDATPRYQSLAHSKISTNSEVDYNLGTAQLEQILNTIKMKATEMIVNQNPSISDLIANTVTEATYGADLVVTRSEPGILANAFSTFVSISDVEDMFYKNLASSTTPIDFYLENTVPVTELHEIVPRSITEDAMTIAQSVEEMLQTQLKEACHKIKQQLSKHFEKGVHTIKSKVNKDKYFGKTSPLSHADKDAPTMAKKTYKSTTPPSKHSGIDKLGKFKNNEALQLPLPRPIHTEDDYAMLKLYGQILTRNQDNVMKMVTSHDSLLKVNKRDHYRLSKRNPETISDLKLKEDIKRMNDDDDNMPQYDYNDNLSNGENAESIAVTTEAYDAKSSVTDDLEKTSMEELLEKISFNDFVNGYKHYLEFQKDQASQNFSNMVKYQAHKHHNVDDIGKYILEKIPPLPSARMKRFFDDTDIDDQELSTKSDESWFKRHFYIFIDNGPPKKYHTSQTISLNYPTLGEEDKPVSSTNPEPSQKGDGDNSLMDAPDETYMTNSSAFNTDISLDELSKTLENRVKDNSLLPSNEIPLQPNQPVSTEVNKLLDPLYLIQRMFGGKKRRTLKHKKFADYPDTTKHLKYERKKRNNNKTRKDIFHDQLIKNRDRDKRQKHHKFVNINMVSQPTAIVRIRDNASTKNKRLQNFVRKFDFRNTKKTAFVKVKRQCRRPQRFNNPLDILKKIFNIKTIKPVTQKLDEFEEFNIITPSIHHTKPTKYSKLLSADEIRKQIPNIPAENLDEVTPPSPYPAKTLFEVKSPLYIYNQPLPNYEMRIKASAATNKSFGTAGTRTPNIDNSSSSISNFKCSPTDLLMNVNIKTLRPAKELSSKAIDDVLQRPLATPEEPLVPEELRVGFENIPKDVFLYEKSSPTTPVPAEINKINETPSVLDVSPTVKNVGEKSTDLEKTTLPHLKNKRRDVLHFQDAYFNGIDNTEADIIDLKNPYSNDKNTDLISRPILNTFDLESYNAATTQSREKIFEDNKSYRAYTDYFNDFAIWNDDILNVEKLTTPMWKQILDSIQNYSCITPSRSNIASKLSDLNDYMNIFFKSPVSKVEQQTARITKKHNVEIMKPTPNYKLNRLNPNVRGEISMALNDKAITESDEVIIEGEAKYISYDNPKNNENDLRIIEEKFNLKDSQLEKPTSNVKNEIIIDYRRTNEPSEDPSMLIDTTILAYDDDVDSIFHDNTSTKKKSRNSNKSVKGKLKLKSATKQPTVMTNEHPKQYYTTLLPMSSIDFDNFLKQNALDVTLVTSPVTTPSSYVDTWSEKHTQASTTGFKNKGVAQNSIKALETKTTGQVSTKLVPQRVESEHKGKLKANEDLVRKVKYYSDSELDSHYSNRVNEYVYINAQHDKRTKRQRENIYQHTYFTFQPRGKDVGRQKKYLDKMKRRMKLFERKTTIQPDVKKNMDIDTVDAMSSYDPKTDETVDVTIISLNDITKTSHFYGPDTSRKEIKSMKYFTNKPDTLSTYTIPITPKTTKKVNDHNDLLYNKALDKMSKTENYLNTQAELTTEPMSNINLEYYSYKPPEQYSMTDFPFINYGHAPKRVRISGKSYKFDILYDRNTNRYDYSKKKKKKADVEDMEPDKTTPSEGIDQLFYIPPILAKNSEVEPKFERNRRSYKHKIEHKTRNQDIVDTIPVFSSTSNHSNSFGKLSQSDIVTEKEKRLSNLWSILKARFKQAKKNKTSTVTVNIQPSEQQRPPAPTKDTNMFTPLTAAPTGNKVTEKSSSDKQLKYSIKEDESDFTLYDYDDPQLGQEFDSRDSSKNRNYTLIKCKNNKNNKCATKLKKRDVEPQNTYTAKDVAALEVIVDLMKNNINNADRTDSSKENDKRTRSTTDPVVRSRDSLNSIEVHIAVPYNMQNGSKRSIDNGPLRVRKVFSAKMSSPVDLAYQVNSYEDTLDQHTTAARKLNSQSTSREGLAQGMYLLVNGRDSKNSYELKPMTLNSGYYTNLTNNGPSQVEGTTIKTHGKVILSKEFVTALNKQLMELFQNIPPGTSLTRKTRDSCSKSNEKSGSLIDWEAIKKYFGHDRVCSCKCEPNKAMCRACAASDAVIGELIFEFDNMANFMKDHCTEIQTYFWMNPSGGKKLREVVHKIDSNLKDYYKRVKGKCQGRTCQTFSLYLDKRGYIKRKKVKKQYIQENILHDLKNLANDLEKSLEIATCFSENLIDSGYKMINSVGECLDSKSLNKRSTAEYNLTTKKNLYTLDNINVNIICSPQMTPRSSNFVSQLPLTPFKPPIFDTGILNIIESNLNQKTRNNKKNRGFKKLFTKKHKLFTYFVSDKIHNSRSKKRDTETQLEIPLISDSGGIFWHDYIKGKTSEPRILSETKIKEPTVGISVIQTKSETTKSTPVTDVVSPVSDILITIQTTPKMLIERGVLSVEDWSSNVEQLTKTTTPGPVDKKKEISTPTIVTEKHQSVTTTKMHNNKKPKKNKMAKEHPISKQKSKTKSTIKNITPINKTMQTHTTDSVHKSTGPSSSSQPSVPSISIGTLFRQNMKANTTPENNNKSKSVFEKFIESITKGDYIIDDKVTTTKATTSKATQAHTPKTTSMFPGTLPTDFFKEENITTAFDTNNQPILYDFMDSITTGNVNITEDYTTDTSDLRKLRYTPTDSYYTFDLIKDSNDKNQYNKQSAEYANLLLSIIKYETSELIDEWLKVATKNSGKLGENNKREYATGDYDVMQSIFPERKVNTHKHKRLLDKIANKVRTKLSRAKKSKADKMARSNILNDPSAHSNETTVMKADVKIVDSNEEAFDPTNRICDLQATYDHISELSYTLPAEEFENYIRNLPCYKYKKAKPFFLIDYPPRKVTRWDWIRKKRSSEHVQNEPTEDGFEHVKMITGTSVIEEFGFENFVKDKDGIYRASNRMKRSVGDLKDLDRELRNVSPLKPAMNEVYAMVGDTVTLDCVTYRRARREPATYRWKSERDDMLKHENVNVDGTSVTIHDVQARNIGSYACSKDDALLRSIRLSVVAPPNYTVLFVPIYSTNKSCDHDDLKAVRLLGPQMSRELSCGERCVVKILEPACQKGKGHTNQMRSTAALTVSVHPSWDCSVQCRRDLQSAFALLCAKSAPLLANTAVVMSSKDGNKTFLPSKSHHKALITKMLRKKGIGHFEYHNLTSGLGPGDVDVVAACPAGFYLVPEQKICVPCPPNTSAAAGANVCSVCPAGTHARHGASACHRADGLRRYDWWWYPPCGYFMACGGCVFVCSVFVAVAMLLHATSRSKTARSVASPRDGQRPKACMRCSVLSSYGRSPRPRHTTPSRVILARFFKPSLTSSRASDSQEMKFDVWKEKNIPPPLPPIDFDL